MGDEQVDLHILYKMGKFRDTPWVTSQHRTSILRMVSFKIGRATLGLGVSEVRAAADEAIFYP